MSEVDKLLTEAIENQFMELASLEAGSEEKARATEDTAKLYRLRIEEVKNEKEAREKTKDRWTRLGVDAGIGLLTAVFNLYVFRKGLKFEEEGTFTSGTLRRFMNNFPKPFKK